MDYEAVYNKHRSYKASARALGISDKTFKKYLERQLSSKKMNLKIHSEVTRIVYFTDAHNQPGLDCDRFHWLAKYVNDANPNYLVDGGDFDDLGSLCRHEGNDTYKGRFKPSFMADLEKANEARQILHENIKVPCAKYVTLGNHEHRLWLFENSNPEIYGMMQHAYMDILHKYGWGITMYGDYKTIQGVDFTHVPMNGMNKPVGGKNPCNIISRDSIRDVCFGHTHGIGLQENHKLGPARSVVAFNGGCFMPDGYVPSYAQNSQKRFWYGAHTLEIVGGRLRVVESMPMSNLQEKYG